jgi:hypothetical protein
MNSTMIQQGRVGNLSTNRPRSAYYNKHSSRRDEWLLHTTQPLGGRYQLLYLYLSSEIDHVMAPGLLFLECLLNSRRNENLACNSAQHIYITSRPACPPIASSWGDSGMTGPHTRHCMRNLRTNTSTAYVCNPARTEIACMHQLESRVCL